nr:hypothetical protein [Candidatus Aminicenantes bacterium]NIM80428.1 hypothetical protein [Candidatus Aminicenantes bacterium]NIN19821.1 hypothetical protein [Candidatus Aminicenantes bacterium]NIN43697.1 hypothetical protein [Candidatus Aminicenantes bacterium]NIN86447.1 hypothetical protein [Candidatus Aminicenantes bacterium]
MGKISILISVLIILFKLSGFLYGAIPASERAALIALYNSTNGDSWTNNSGWKTPPLDTDGFAMPGTENTWYGIVSGINVTQISLSNNNLSGSIPSTLGNLGSLELLNMCDNQLSGSIPSELGNLNSLWGIFLNTNQLSGSIPSELANISILQDLYLHYNQLSGSIPPELGNVSTLEGLNLSNNQLSGSIPSELGNLSRLDWLSLSGNQLSGSIPSELGNLGRLECLSLAENRLSGSIPPELGNLANLETLWLDRNLLSGSIPPELGNLLNLKQFLLIYNQLGGSIPSSITNLTNLTYAEIGYNALYTNNDTVRTFLDEKFPGWDSTQTIAPANVSASSMSTSSIRVSWTPILYTGDNGGYKVYYSTTSGGPYTYSGITADKLNTYYDVTGLSPGTTYYLVVKTQTDPHHYSYNGVVSEYSEEVSATTTGALGEKDPPFGSFDTPIDGSTVASSIAVTGWALDDTGIDNVKIYRQQ